MKRVTKIIICICAAAVVAAGVAAAVIQQNVKLIGTKIAFPELLGGTIDVKNISYDAEKLASQVDDSYGYVYSDPQLTDYGIVSELGFDKDVYTVNSSGERLYRSGNKELKIDEYGMFEFKTGNKSTGFNMTLTDKEVRKIAIDYLKKLGLFKNIQSYSMNETQDGSLVSGELQLETTEKAVTFFLGINGHDIINGEKIYVSVNGNGEVLEVCNWTHKFGRKTLQPLVDIGTVMADPYAFNCNVYCDVKLDNYKIDKAEMYYQVSESNGNITVQPVYAFSCSEAAGIAADEEEDGVVGYTMFVQANKLPENEK